MTPALQPEDCFRLQIVIFALGIKLRIMKKLVVVFLFLLTIAVSFPATVHAQCAMCTVSAEQSVKNGNTQGKGLNTGIIYLLVIPYLLISGMGALWYLKYRKKTPVYAENV